MKNDLTDPEPKASESWAIRPLSPLHFALALLIVFIWGTNFAIIKFALLQMPPFLLAFLRFTLAFLPAAFFIPFPKVAINNLMLYGACIGLGQFGLLFFAIHRYISPGIASLVVQSQVFFTIFFSVIQYQEKISKLQWLALTLALGGLSVVVINNDAETTLWGLFLVILAALCWSLGNLTAKKSQSTNFFHYVVWSSVFSAIPLLLISLYFEGWDLIASSLSAADWRVWSAVLWQSWGNTLLGYAAWAWLLSQYPSSVIAPLALLVPLFGMAASNLWMGELLPEWKLFAAGLILLGLMVNGYASTRK
jgi:O-acetylserine/cysteine efflux transporter